MNHNICRGGFETRPYRYCDPKTYSSFPFDSSTANPQPHPRVYNQPYMSEFFYLPLHPESGNTIEHLTSQVEQHLSQLADSSLPPADVRKRLDDELTWIDQNGMAASWLALVQLVKVALEKRIPLGAPLGSADGTLIGAVLCELPDPALHTRPLPSEATGNTIPPPGIEIPQSRREELLQAAAPDGDWSAWTPDTTVESGQPVLWLRATPALTTLDAALGLAARYPSPGLDADSINSQEWPTPNERAISMLKAGEVMGIPYLSTKVLKAWKEDFSPKGMTGIVARSTATQDQSKPPEGIAAWDEHTAGTGGALLYFDQFASIIASAGIAPQDAAALRLAMLNPASDAEGALQAQFMEGCVSSGIEDEPATALWKALAASAPHLISRQVAQARARMALWMAALKTAHPAAFLAAALQVAQGYGDHDQVAPLVDEAQRLGIALLPLDTTQEQTDPVLQHEDENWSILWEKSLFDEFTKAPARIMLRRVIGASGGLRSKLTTTARIGPDLEGQSACLVGLLTDIRLLDSTEVGGDRGEGAASSATVDTLAVAWVEDLEGGIELVAFPPNYRRHQELWAENSLLIVTARVRKQPDGEGVYLLCEHLAPYQVGVEEEEMDLKLKAIRRGANGAGGSNGASEPTAPLPTPEVRAGNGGSRYAAPTSRATYPAAPETKAAAQGMVMPDEPPAYHLIVTLSASDDDQADIDRMIALKRLLRAHPGPDNVTLRVPYSPETGGVTSAKLPWGVRYNSGLETDIRDLLGPEALALIKLLG